MNNGINNLLPRKVQTDNGEISKPRIKQILNRVVVFYRCSPAGAQSRTELIRTYGVLNEPNRPRTRPIRTPHKSLHCRCAWLCVDKAAFGQKRPIMRVKYLYGYGDTTGLSYVHNGRERERKKKKGFNSLPCYCQRV